MTAFAVLNLGNRNNVITFGTLLMCLAKVDGPAKHKEMMDGAEIMSGRNIDLISIMWNVLEVEVEIIAPM